MISSGLTPPLRVVVAGAETVVTLGASPCPSTTTSTRTVTLVSPGLVIAAPR
jgi:hypothetical protein